MHRVHRWIGAGSGLITKLIRVLEPRLSHSHNIMSIWYRTACCAVLKMGDACNSLRVRLVGEIVFLSKPILTSIVLSHHI